MSALTYRETIVISLGLFYERKTKKGLYDSYTKLHSRLSRAGLISFELPLEKRFRAMIRKLLRQDILVEQYNDMNYVLQLSEKGKAQYDILINRIMNTQSYQKLYNIYQLYQQASAY